MASLSRALRRWRPQRVAAAGLGLALAIVLGAYLFGVTESRLTTGGALAAVSFLAISATGLLYAWRLGTGAPVE